MIAMELKLIKQLYNAGKNHLEIAMKLFVMRKAKGISTTQHDCMREVETALLEMHRRKIKD
jgi:hypothetical protein